MSIQIVYQPDPNSTDAYCVYVDNNEEYEKWKAGDTTIALTSFVGKFEVYHSATGAQGQWETASKAQLENDLSSKNKDDAVIKVLKEGNNRTAKGVGRTKESAVKNAAQDGGNSVSKGAMSGGHHGGR